MSTSININVYYSTNRTDSTSAASSITVHGACVVNCDPSLNSTMIFINSNFMFDFHFHLWSHQMNGGLLLPRDSRSQLFCRTKWHITVCPYMMRNEESHINRITSTIARTFASSLARSCSWVETKRRSMCAIQAGMCQGRLS